MPSAASELNERYCHFLCNFSFIYQVAIQFMVYYFFKRCTKFVSHNIYSRLFNLQMPNVNYSGRTAPLTSKVAFYIFIQQIQVLNLLNMVYTLRFFFSSKCSLFHNSNVFGSCIIHVLYTGCAKIKKIIPAPEGQSCLGTHVVASCDTEFLSATFGCHIQHGSDDNSHKLCHVRVSACMSLFHVLASLFRIR